MSNSLQPHGLYPTRLLGPWDLPGKHTGVGCHFLLEGIFPTQGSNPGFPHYRQTLYRLSHREVQDWKGKHKVTLCVCVCVCVCVWSRFSGVWLLILWTVAHQDPLSRGFSRQEYWSGLPLPPPGNLSNPGIEPLSLMSPALAGKFFTTSTTWEAQSYHMTQQFHS